MPIIDVHDTSLYYERAGSGPAVLFVHGMCGDAEVWADQAQRLYPRLAEFRAICQRYDPAGVFQNRWTRQFFWQPPSREE